MNTNLAQKLYGVWIVDENNNSGWVVYVKKTENAVLAKPVPSNTPRGPWIWHEKIIERANRAAEFADKFPDIQSAEVREIDEVTKARVVKQDREMDLRIR